MMNDRKIRLMVWANLKAGTASDFRAEYLRLELEKREFLADRVRAFVLHVRNTQRKGMRHEDRIDS